MDSTASLNLRLLGSPAVDVNAQEMHFPSRHCLALLAYLAVSREPQRRELIIDLLWPESSADRALASLRNTLYGIRKAIGERWIDSTRSQVSLVRNSGYRCDFEVLEDAYSILRAHDHRDEVVCAECRDRLGAAVELYRSDFMKGFGVRGSYTFDDWQLFHVEAARRKIAESMKALINTCIADQNYDEAFDLTKKLLAVDRLDESTYRFAMEYYARIGNRTEAIRTFRRCESILVEEIGFAPSEATRELYDKITDGSFQQPRPDRGLAPHEPILSYPIPVELESERRYISVLTFGLGGMSDDGFLTNRLSQIGNAILHAYGGKLCYVNGDQIVSAFGLYQTRESDPETAVRTARAVNETAEQNGLSIRAGISTGWIYHAPAAVEATNSIQLVGSTSRISELLFQHASPGQILVNESTANNVAGIFDCYPSNETIALNGRNLRIHIVEREAAEPHRRPSVRSSLFFAGRKAEFAKAMRAIDSWRDGNGVLILISGDAGIGKSRLLEEVCRNLKRDDTYLRLVGRCISSGSPISYLPYIDALRSYFHLRDRDSLHEKIGKVSDGVARLNLPDETKHIAMLCYLFSLESESTRRYVADKTPEQMKQQSLVVIRNVIEQIGRRTRLMLVLEDLHWADDPSIDLTADLLNSLSSSAIAMCCAFRTEYESRADRLTSIARGRCAERMTEIELGPLSQSDSVRLVKSATNLNVLPEKTISRIVAIGDGTPFYLEEIARSVIESNDTHIPEISVPESIQSVVASRIDRLSIPARKFIRYAAILGRLFRLGPLEVLLKDPDVGEALRACTNEGLIYQERTIPENEFAFHHAIIHDAVYLEIPAEERRVHHRTAAQVLEEIYSDSIDEKIEEIAYHFSRSEEIGKAVEYLALAAEKARRIYANEVAIEHCRRGLDLVATMPEGSAKDQLEIRLQLAIYGPLSLVEGHSSPKVVEACDRVIILGRSVGASHELLEALHGLASSSLASGDLHKVHECVVSHHKVAVGLGDRATLMDDSLLAGADAYFRGDFQEVPKYMLKVPELYVLEEDREFAAVRGHDPRVTSQAYLLLAEWMMGYPDRAKETYARTVRYAVELDHEPTTRFAEVYYLMYFALLRDYERVKSVARETAEASNRLSLMLLEFVAGIARSCADFHLDPCETTLNEMAKRIEEYEATGLRVFVGFYRECLAGAHLSQGDPAGALATIEETISRIETGGGRYRLAENHRLRGEILAALGRPSDEVAASFDRAIEVARSQSARMLELRAQISRVRALSGSAGETDAPAGLREVYDWFTEGFDSPEMLDAKALLHVPVPDN